MTPAENKWMTTTLAHITLKCICIKMEISKEKVCAIPIYLWELVSRS